MGLVAKRLGASCIAIAFGLGGCSSGGGGLTATTFPDLAGQPVGPGGVAVASAEIADLACGDGRIVVARADDDGYIPVATLLLSQTYAGRRAVAVADFAPGDYAIVHYACRNGANVTYVGASDTPGGVPWRGARYSGALATFSIGIGDIVDLGRLVFSPEAGDGFILKAKDRKVATAVTPLSSDLLKKAEGERPEIAGRVVARPMVVAAGAPTRLEKCALLAEAPKAASGGGIAGEMTGPTVAPTACRRGEGLEDRINKVLRQGT